jgi:hypothetical protein
MGLFVSGCGSNQLQTAPVQGTVSLDGRPLESGQVVFTPSQGRGARGQLNRDGTFVLTTYTDGDGAIVGVHQVAILPVIPLGEAAGAEAEVSSESLIPRRYLAGATSKLTFEVEPHQANHANFELHTDELSARAKRSHLSGK